MAIQDTHPHAQAVRRVYENEQPNYNSGALASNIIHIACHPDPSSGKDIILWDDIKAASDDVMHVRSGTFVLPFLKGTDFKNLDPLRIASVPGVTLDVVVRGQLETAKELSVELLQGALSDISQESNRNNSNSHSTATITAIATTAR
ncbi:hypothetical protein BGZ96_011875 [Linnemannia gamsii]|uniref:Uncharacterized protein n=1 Tax=Linnemannia gamsii TaxID=64522 RepID=A0ABQ7JRG2_9FUNG|nr:hypothetical protein BGZ96_011875 [Linnemannia gamsii]